MTLQDFYQRVNDGRIDAVIDTKSSVRFNGKTVVIHPEKSSLSNGFPSMDPKSYIKKNHPDLLREFESAAASRNEEHTRIDNYLTGGNPS